MNKSILTQSNGADKHSMNSLQIAELTDSRHDNVKRTIERLADQEVISQPPMEDGKKSANGVVTQLYVFTGEQGKLDSITVVAQLCPEFTASIVKRWQKLESLVSSHEYQTILQQNESHKIELLKARPIWSDILRYKRMGLKTVEISKLVERSTVTVNQHVRSMKALGFMIQSEPQPAQLALALRGANE